MPIAEGDRVLLVDDVVTSGSSILTAYRRVLATGAKIVAALAVVDRGDNANRLFREQSVPYRALVTYRDLGIEAVSADGPPPVSWSA